MRLIDADALMKVIREHDYPLRSHFNSIDNGMFTIGVQQVVDESPTIEAVPVVRGEWRVIGMRPVGTRLTHYCSVCEGHGSDDMNYCPNCGAKMESEA